MRLLDRHSHPDPRMSMSGRLSVETNPSSWGYGALPQYAPDGVPLTPNHGRRSSIYRAQNSTLFSAFEEDGLGPGAGLTDLQEEDEDDRSDDGRNTNTTPTKGNNGAAGRTLVGKGVGVGGRGREVDGGRHPVYQDGGV